MIVYSALFISYNVLTIKAAKKWKLAISDRSNDYFKENDTQSVLTHSE